MKIKPKCFHFSWVFPVSVVLLCLFETLCVACQISFGPVSASSNMTTDHQLTCAVTLFFLRCRGNSWQQNVFAIEYPPDVLVARPAIWGLNVLAHVEEASVNAKKLWDSGKFSPLFTRVQQMKKVYKPDVEPDTMVYAVPCPRRVPIPLVPRV